MARADMTVPRYPSLYQVNTRVWLTELSRALGHAATLDDVPDADLDRFAAQGFDWVWLLSAWQTGAAGRQVSRTNPEWRREFEETLPDLREDDIAGSGFAIAGYTVADPLGGRAALARLRAASPVTRPSPDAGFRAEPHRPGSSLGGPASRLLRAWHGGRPRPRARELHAAFIAAEQTCILAHGRDPYFPGWPDTLQLDYANPALQDAMIGELLTIAGQCDGVRCDMAMLVLPEIFERTWGRPSGAFWPRATDAVRQRVPGFCFMAEVYWDLEWTLQQQGFDYTYDKRLYDRLREGHARPVREHLHAGLDYQDRLARFLENHDEPRAAATFPDGRHEAAAVLTYLAPGLRFFHQGQFDGRTRRISPHLCRGPEESVDQRLAGFYDRLLAVLRRPALRTGEWRLLPCGTAWDGNGTWDNYVAYSWQLGSEDRLIVAVNAASTHSQGFVRLPFGDLAGRQWRLEDLLGDAVYVRDGGELQTWGLFLDEPPWKAQVFALCAVK